MLPILSRNHVCFVVAAFSKFQKKQKQKKNTIQFSQAESGHYTHIVIIMNNMIWKYQGISNLWFPGMQKFLWIIIFF